MLRIRQDSGPAVTGARVWAEVDLEAIRDNVRAVRGSIGADRELLAVVKSDAYGHGAVPVARAALAAGAGALGVSHAEEATALRGARLRAPIHVLGPSTPADAPAIVAYELVPALADLELARALAAVAARRGASAGRIDVELEIDTGMRRHGVPAADAVAFARALRLLPELRLVGVFTHFAATDGRSVGELAAQWRRFAQVTAALRAAGHELRVHACNTLAAALLPEAHGDRVRIGGGLYGLGAVGWSRLRPALRLVSTLAGVRCAVAGDAVGYGASYRCPRDTVLGLVPCGYADGLSRALWNDAEVLVGGRRRRVVGHVSMNQLVVDLGPRPDAGIGDEVVLIGAQGSEQIRAEERARGGASVYEVTAALRPQLVRRYVGELASGRR